MTDPADLLLGAHMSTAGGVSRAFERGGDVGCTTMQIFTKSPNQWAARPLDGKEIDRFKTAWGESGIAPVVAHDAYLINIASPDRAMREKSIDALLDEVERVEVLGIPSLVIHPGAHMKTGEKAGIDRVAESLDTIHARTEGSSSRILLETTAGQGTNLGYRFEHLAEIIDRVKEPERLGVCFDTCHAFAAGYDISREETFGEVFSEFDSIIGLSRLEVMHLNDSKGKLGSRLDRHEHIGKGHIGIEGFRLIMTDPRLVKLPKILETPKGADMAEDRINLKTLRRLALGA